MKNTLTATIFVTDTCNLACKYCYEKDKKSNENTKSNIDRFLNLIMTDKHFDKFDSLILDFIGGEALLKFPLMEYAMTEFLVKGKQLNHRFLKDFKFFTSTNGTLFENKDILAFIYRWPCLEIGVSLDGCKEAQDMNRVYPNGRGSYNDIMNTFGWWKDKYQGNMVKGTLSPDTLPLLDKMLINQAKLGMRKLWANPIYEHDWTEAEGLEYKDKIFKVIDWLFENDKENKVEPLGSELINAEDVHKLNGNDFHYCGTCDHMITLGMDGKLYPCHRFATSTSHKFAIGDVVNGIDDNKVKMLKDGLTKIDSEYDSTFDPICYSAYYDREGLFKNYNAIHNIAKHNKEIKLYWKNKENEKKYHGKLYLEVDTNNGNISSTQEAISTNETSLFKITSNMANLVLKLISLYKYRYGYNEKLDDLIHKITLSLEE